MIQPKTPIAVIFLLFLAAFPLVSQQAAAGTASSKETQYEYDGTVLKRILMDASGDGTVDYIITLNAEGDKETEERDYNNDGMMDDFYYYSSGILVRREIDSNYDSRVDIWVHIKDGIYVEKYERDTDFDGVADVVKEFGDGQAR